MVSAPSMPAVVDLLARACGRPAEYHDGGWSVPLLDGGGGMITTHIIARRRHARVRIPAPGGPIMEQVDVDGPVEDIVRDIMAMAAGVRAPVDGGGAAVVADALDAAPSVLVTRIDVSPDVWLITPAGRGPAGVRHSITGGAGPAGGRGRYATLHDVDGALEITRGRLGGAWRGVDGCTEHDVDGPAAVGSIVADVLADVMGVISTT